jgi:hypothetical protein
VSKRHRIAGLGVVFGLVIMALMFLVFVIDEAGRQGAEFMAVGLVGLVAIAGMLLLGPVGKAIASLLAGEGGEDHALAARVADLEDRLQELTLESQRFLEIEERLDFTERLLTQHGEALPPGDAR